MSFIRRRSVGTIHKLATEEMSDCDVWCNLAYWYSVKGQPLVLLSDLTCPTSNLGNYYLEILVLFPTEFTSGNQSRGIGGSFFATGLGKTETGNGFSLKVYSVKGISETYSTQFTVKYSFLNLTGEVTYTESTAIDNATNINGRRYKIRLSQNGVSINDNTIKEFDQTQINYNQSFPAVYFGLEGINYTYSGTSPGDADQFLWDGIYPKENPRIDGIYINYIRIGKYLEGATETTSMMLHSFEGYNNSVYDFGYIDKCNTANIYSINHTPTNNYLYYQTAWPDNLDGSPEEVYYHTIVTA